MGLAVSRTQARVLQVNEPFRLVSLYPGGHCFGLKEHEGKLLCGSAHTSFPHFTLLYSPYPSRVHSKKNSWGFILCTPLCQKLSGHCASVTCVTGNMPIPVVAHSEISHITLGLFQVSIRGSLSNTVGSCSHGQILCRCQYRTGRYPRCRTHRDNYGVLLGYPSPSVCIQNIRWYRTTEGDFFLFFLFQLLSFATVTINIFTNNETVVQPDK